MGSGSIIPPRAGQVRGKEQLGRGDPADVIDDARRPPANRAIHEREKDDKKRIREATR